ncbi:hypothetical protein KMD50_gp55 [Lactococcus phage PLgW-1]|uniref:Uncharacterized protein n=3 Tax=Uwajimavirus PLgW1 TaxID=2845441 RepID=A0A2Z2PAZ8_9CAUD|nr:hypothetical protein KMD50_gp55 [Lactococcus phage PLgW-1]ARQ94866.1 hypothetical protein PLgW1_55 [Lactococcus phage PLgW-1]ASJ80038.1 hypothetical protein [Lactococcus phage PLgY-16]ASJ80091.1 hypothetical protein [Lactococcus phage PLgY-30]
MGLAVTITFWIVIVLCVINANIYMFTSYQEDIPRWARVFSIVWNVWLVFVMFISLGII